MTCSSAIKPEWSPITVGLMVLGFIVFWPLGLAMLAYILWGDKFHSWKKNAHQCWDKNPMKEAMSGMHTYRSGNVAFDEFRETELKRLEEERAKLDEMRREFDDYMKELRMARDREEFERFMNARHNRQTGEAL